VPPVQARRFALDQHESASFDNLIGAPPVAADSDLHRNAPARQRRFIDHAITFGIFVVTACDRADVGELKHH